MLVALGKGQDVLLRLVGGYRQGGVDVDLVGGGDLVQHGLELFNVGKRLAAGKHKIAVRGDGVHPADALADLFQREARQIRVLAFVDAEGAVVIAVIRDKNRHRGAAFTRLVGMFHDDRSAFRNIYGETVRCTACDIAHLISLMDFVRQVKRKSEISPHF